MELSIIIPVYNGEQFLRPLLEALLEQSVQAGEILVVDSSSTDASVEICKEYPVELVSIAREEFDHGGTRSMMAKRASGEYLLFMTQDALPESRSSVANLIRPFGTHQELAMTYGRQLPKEDATFAAAHLRRFNYRNESKILRYADRKTEGLRTIFTSNSFAAYRASALAEVGYFKSGLIFGEDTCSAGRLLQKGYAVSYVSDAVVYHSHNYTISQEFKRYFDIGVLHRVESPLFTDFGRAERRGMAYLKSGLTELIRSGKYALIPEFWVRTIMKLIGYKAGKNFKKFPAGVVPELSLHKSWWSKQH